MENVKNKFKNFNWGLTALTVPGLFILIAMYFVPLFGLVIPFKKMDVAKGIFKSPWVGFDNFKFLFNSPDLWRITRNTLGLNFVFISLTLLTSVFLALMLFELSASKVKVFQTSMFVPYFISWVVGGYIIYALLSPDLGVLPNVIESLGGTAPNFYHEPKYWPYILTLSYLWKHIGYNTLLFYATLMGMDPGLGEAASIDGASKMQMMRYISIPHLKPTIILMALLMIGKVFFADFGMFHFLPRDSGSLYSVTNVIDTYVFRALRVTGDIGMASAAGLYQSIVGFLLVLFSNYAVRKYDKDQALF